MAQPSVSAPPVTLMVIVTVTVAHMHEMFRIWLRYLAVGAAAIPAGIVFVLLTWKGIPRNAATIVSVATGLMLAKLAWNALARHISIPTERPDIVGVHVERSQIFYGGSLVYRARYPNGMEDTFYSAPGAPASDETDEDMLRFATELSRRIKARSSGSDHVAPVHGMHRLPHFPLEDRFFPIVVTVCAKIVRRSGVCLIWLDRVDEAAGAKVVKIVFSCFRFPVLCINQFLFKAIVFCQQVVILRLHRHYQRLERDYSRQEYHTTKDRGRK